MGRRGKKSQAELTVIAPDTSVIEAIPRAVAQLLHAEETKPLLDLDEYDRLLRLQERETRIIASLATKMRLSQQSVYGPRAANIAKRNTPTTSKPWEA